jgi:hypothetical protein
VSLLVALKVGQLLARHGPHPPSTVLTLGGCTRSAIPIASPSSAATTRVAK